MHPVFVQAFYYGILMVLTIGMVGFIQKGFFWKYIKVRMSFGKFILVKIKSVTRDHFAVGWVDEGSLVYKYKFNKKPTEKRINIESGMCYRALAISWIDVDEEKNCIIIQGKEVEGFDAVKMNNLYVRALYQPQLNDNREKMMMGLLLIGVILGGLGLLLAWQNYTMIDQILRKGVGAVVPAVI